MTDVTDLSNFLNQIAQTTLEAMGETLGGEFEACIMIYPNPESMDANKGKPVPIGMYATGEDGSEGLAIAVGLANDQLNPTEEFSPIWTPPGAGVH
jgi:hypothetical protein